MPFRERASGQNGRLNPLRMDITTEAGALFDNHPRRKNKALLLDIAIVNPCAAPIWRMQHAMYENTSPTQSSGRKTSVRARSPLFTPSFLSLCRLVGRLAQTYMPSSRSSLSDVNDSNSGDGNGEGNKDGIGEGGGGAKKPKKPHNKTSSMIAGGRGCNIFVPVLGGNGMKITPTGDIFDQPPGQMR